MSIWLKIIRLDPNKLVEESIDNGYGTTNTGYGTTNVDAGVGISFLNLNRGEENII